MTGTRTPMFGRNQPGGIFTIANMEVTTGDTWFVDSTTGTDAAGFGQGPDSPTATLDFAIGLATAAKGDRILVMPGHTESSSTTNAEIFDIDKAGIEVIGLGHGDQRPTFTLEEAGVTCVIGAAGCRLSNVRIIGNITDLVTGIEVEAAATGCRIDHCYIGDSGTTLDMLVAVAIAANADRFVFDHNHVNITKGGEATEGLAFAGGSDGCRIHDNYIYGDWKTNGAIDMSTALSLGIEISHNNIINTDAAAGLCILGNSGTTGGYFYNSFLGGKDNTVPVSETTLIHSSQNFGADIPNVSAILTPVAPAVYS